jgi:hypothetical protein
MTLVAGLRHETFGADVGNTIMFLSFDEVVNILGEARQQCHR